MVGIHTETAATDIVAHFQTQNSVLLLDCQVCCLFVCFSSYFQLFAVQTDSCGAKYKYHQIVRIFLNIRNMTEEIFLLEAVSKMSTRIYTVRHAL